MNKENLDKWFAENVSALERNYIIHNGPRKQSGFSGSEYKWTKCRKPIADSIDKSGTFLDIGCANGYLLQSIIKWKYKDGIRIVPYGLDIGVKLLALARKRFPSYTENFFHGNIQYWEPSFKFDYVRTELLYVPKGYGQKLIERLLKGFVKTNGKLILCEYRSSTSVNREPWINVYIEKSGYNIIDSKSGYFRGKELTKVISITPE